MATPKRTTPNHDASEILDTLDIARIKPRKSCGGSWVIGKIAGHRFEALVFPEHAESSDFELADSRISKLWMRNMDTGATAAEFDRGWVTQPTSPAAAAIVHVLAAGLAEHVYGN
jgi:hypothetical protein